MASGRAIGAEALLRWRDPQRGWVSPGVFIPIAESRGMICALGRWVLAEACRQMRAWVDAGLRFPGRLWINLAAQQLEEADLVASIRGITGAAGIAPGCLALELTESGLMADVEGSIRTMATLREDGFAIAIDDFGTGYSSLAYLKRLPADKLKIDMSFVRDMLTDRHDYTIVTTIIGMARNLGLEVIAEGVEEGAQAQALRSLGCGAGLLFRQAGAGRGVCRNVARDCLTESPRRFPYGGHPVPTRLRAYAFAYGRGLSPANPSAGHVRLCLSERCLTARDYGPVRTAWARSAHRTISPAAGRC